MLVLILGTVLQLRSLRCLVQWNSYFPSFIVNLAQNEISLLSTHMQLASHDDLGPLLSYYCSSRYYLIFICALQVSSIDITTHGNCLYWISSLWFKLLLQFSGAVMNSDPFLQSTHNPSQPVIQGLFYVCYIPSSKLRIKRLTRVGTKEDFRRALPKISFLFNRERIENSLPKLHFSTSHTSIHGDYNSLLCWYWMTKSLIKSEYFTCSASPPSAKQDHSSEKETGQVWHDFLLTDPCRTFKYCILFWFLIYWLFCTLF